MSSSSDDNETWSSSDNFSDDEIRKPNESDASPAAMAHSKTGTMLSKFLAKLRPRMLNLMNEFADADMFLIDGDSLLMELLLDTNLDWCYGGQFLHLIYLCERYLHLFVRKGGIFQLVFFQDFQDLWKCEPSLYLARQVLKIHLSEHVENKVLCKFNNPWDPSFAEYVNTFCPSFMLLSDGEFKDRLSSRPFSIPAIMSDVFLCELGQCLKLGLNCAFTGGVEFGPSTLDAYHIQSHESFMVTKLATDNVMDKVRLGNKKFQIVIGQNIENILGQLSNTSVDHVEECKNDGSHDLDCRLFLHVATASIYLKSLADQPCKASQLDIVRLVLLHGVLLTELPLKYRALSLGKCDEVKEPVVRQNLLRCFANIQFVMSEFLENLLISPLAWSKVDICDVWDGRLLFVLLSVLLTAKKNGEGISLSPCSKRKFISVVNDVSSMSGEEIEPFPILSSLGENLHSDLESVLNFTQSRNDQASSSDSCLRVIEHLTSPELEGLIEVDCPLFSQYVGEIFDNPLVKKLDLDDPSVAALVMSGNDFDETYHWYSGKSLSDEYDRTKQNKFEAKDKRHLMRQQGKFVTYMRRYGESLEGELRSKPIVVENHGGKRGKKDKSKISKGAQKIIDESNKRKKEEVAKKEAELWVKEQKNLQYLVERQKYDDALAKIVNLIGKVSVEKIIIDVLMIKANVYWKKWKLVCEGKEVPPESDISDAVMCFLTIRELVENHEECLHKKYKAVLAEYLVGLGFGDIAVKTSLLNELIPSSGGSINMSSVRFQMQCIGHQLKRETRTDRDPRVDNFIPETWQRELLNAVDNKQSALIVAPTSSGKTFASYYCMERVLKEDNEGVVVYVSPTKALVNQVAATCYARYHNKVMPAGKSVYGVFTRDYRTNTLNSQILVTVPQCLEILLLSPHRQEWAAKIKYVVFDEVHCLGSEIGAEFWEHLLLLVRCPFLALSATIRNPNDLHKWLQCAEDNKRERDEKSNTVRPNSPKSYEVALVTYHERYSDLEKFNYVSLADAKKESSQVNPELKHVHPCAMLTFRHLNQSPTFPAHITLSPRETLALFDAMVKAWPEKDTMQSLCPENHFKDTAFISKPDARLYEAALKKELMTWVVDRPRIEMVIVGLGGKSESEFGTQKAGADYVIQQFFPLLQELHENNKLPAIFFSYNRALCELLTGLTVKHLCKKEKMLQQGQNVQRKAKMHEKRSRKVAKLEKRFRDDADDEEKLRKTNSTGHKDSHKQRKQVTSEANCFLFENPPKESCSFAGVGVLDNEDGQVIVQKLRFHHDLSTFNEGLRRGVSYHHSGMPAGIRSIVEMLFRKKFLRVVFATGTLALGIHMPCKTVIFAGDSPFLNTLQFHQISGRAGRRGFDLLGNVIFLGISQPKIQRLMTNNLPRIIGNFPLNATLILRLLLMVTKADDRETAMNQALALLQNPLICMDQPELDLQLKHHFLFSVELLVRQGLIDQKGVPQGLAGLATHLHYHEPSNFVFVAFLQEGIFHDFCKRGRSTGGKFSKDFLKSLVVVLSHLFARVKLHGYILRGERSTSKVVLDELPPKFKKALAKYNNRVNGIFDLYLRTVATHVHNTMAEDITLPLSNASLISSESYTAEPDATESGPTVEETLQALSLPFKACSAFAALSGNADNHLYSSDDHISNIRYQVYTDIKVVPIVKDDVILNAYVVDFFNHGNVKALTSENGIMRGEVFNLLKDFLLVLKSIHVSLSQLGPEDGDAVIAAFGQLVDEYSSLFNKTFNIDCLI